MQTTRGRFTPFLVVDRPASLRLVAELELPQGKHIGLMTHANTSENFRNLFREFIHSNPKQIFPTMCDSGVFQRQGCLVDTYNELFCRYQEMGTQYGIVIDFLKDERRTLESAKKALQVYGNKHWAFKLVGVAQGNSLQEYVDCYSELRRMGFEHIAIGGMLQRKERSARYVRVRDEEFLRSTLKTITKADPSGWLFALGCYSPKRHNIFLENNVFGSDYKGWIFQYDGSSPKRGDRRAQTARFKQVVEFLEKDVLCRNQHWRKGPRLIVIPCSKRKRVFRDRAQAINVYDGPMYRLLRHYVTDFSNNNGMDIQILSAKYGLIHPRTPIANYDMRMTRERAKKLEPRVKATIEKLFSEKKYAQVLVNLGADYMQAVSSSLKYCPSSTEVKIVGGGIGKRLSATKDWLLS